LLILFNTWRESQGGILRGGGGAVKKRKEKLVLKLEGKGSAQRKICVDQIRGLHVRRERSRASKIKRSAG